MGDPTSWADPKTRIIVRKGEAWRDAAPIYRGTRYPLRTLDVMGAMEDVVRGKRRVRIQARTRDLKWRRKLIKGRLVTIELGSFVKRFRLGSADATVADPNALKPCPFCGASGESNVKVGKVDGGSVVACWLCATRGPLGTYGEAEARRLWNTRAEGGR